jgi:hypothetical protein
MDALVQPLTVQRSVRPVEQEVVEIDEEEQLTYHAGAGPAWIPECCRIGQIRRMAANIVKLFTDQHRSDGHTRSCSRLEPLDAIAAQPLRVARRQRRQRQGEHEERDRAHDDCDQRE